MTADLVRRRELGAIHTAKKSLALTDDSYRDLLERETGKRSAKELDARQRARVIEAFRKLGWGRSPSPGSPRPAVPRQAAARQPSLPRAPEIDSRQVRKLRALWLSLWQLGEVDDPSETALEHFATSLTKRDRMRWTDAADLVWVTEGLIDWCRRAGYDARSPLRPWSPAPETWDSRLIEAQWQRLIALGAFETGIFAHLGTWLKRTLKTDAAAPQFLSPRDQRRAVRLLGEWLRKIKAERGEAS